MYRILKTPNWKYKVQKKDWLIVSYRRTIEYYDPETEARLTRLFDTKKEAEERIDRDRGWKIIKEYY